MATKRKPRQQPETDTHGPFRRPEAVPRALERVSPCAEDAIDVIEKLDKAEAVRLGHLFFCYGVYDRCLEVADEIQPLEFEETPPDELRACLVVETIQWEIIKDAVFTVPRPYAKTLCSHLMMKLKPKRKRRENYERDKKWAILFNSKKSPEWIAQH